MKLMFWFVLLFLSSFAAAQEASFQFETANQLYRNSEYKKAAEQYEKIILGGYENPMLYYNLGNAYFKLQDIPSSILNYERAKRLSPHDEDILYNLRIANLRITDKIEPLPRLFFEDWWLTITTLYSSDGWGVAGTIGMWSAAVGGIIFLSLRSYFARRVVFVVVSLMFVFTVFAFIGMVQQLHREQSEHAVVFSPSISVKSAPDNQSVDLFVLHEGINVELLDMVGEWRKIRLSDGKIGWLRSSSIQVI